MTQATTNLGEIGAAGANASGLTPIDLPLQRDGGDWNLTGYSDEAIDVWDLRTKEAVATPGGITVQQLNPGVIRWTPDYSQYATGIYEARIRLSPNGGTSFEHSGLFRFAIGTAGNPTPP
jgi:hypothetical protein